MILNHKTIMHLIATNFYGGPEKQIIEHLIRLDKNYYRGMIASFSENQSPNETLDRAKTAGLTYHGIPMAGPLDVRAQWKLNRILRQEKVDLLCAHGYKACVMGWWAGLRLKIPVLAFSRGYTAEDIKVAFYEWLERRVIGKLAGIVFVSEGQKKKLESFGIQGRKSWVVHNAVSVDSLRKGEETEMRGIIFERLGIPKNSKMVVTAGRLSPEKGHRFLVEAIGKMGKKAKNTFFIFCGEGPCKKDLEKQAHELGIYERCRFPGFRRDLQEIFQVMDLMILPSLTEGLPNVILEAFAYEKPVVATAVGGVSEVVEDGKNGFLIQPGYPDLLAKAMIRCLETPEIGNAMGEYGYTKVKSSFSFADQTRRLEEIYNEVLAQRGTQRR
jgi:glycosyltransferase involved in cell wall biosynthesis